jgi:uncharacterized protein YndB with AHSA1/START domain
VNETKIELDEKVPLVRIVREFDAPPAKVFRAHAEAELFARWNGPDGSENDLHVFDCRTGGSWRYTGRGEGWEESFHGSFHDVIPNERIVQTFTWDGMPEGVSLDTLTFTDLGGGRTRLESTSLVDSFEGRDGFVAAGMETGINEGYQRLDALLATLTDLPDDTEGEAP